MQVSLGLNVATTDFAAVIDKVQEDVPEQALDHPANIESEEGIAVKVTDVPEVYSSEQSVPQDIPDGEEVIVPEPVPVLETESRYFGADKHCPELHP